MPAEATPVILIKMYKKVAGKTAKKVDRWDGSAGDQCDGTTNIGKFKPGKSVCYICGMLIHGVANMEADPMASVTGSDGSVTMGALRVNPGNKTICNKQGQKYARLPPAGTWPKGCAQSTNHDYGGPQCEHIIPFNDMALLIGLNNTNNSTCLDKIFGKWGDTIGTVDRTAYEEWQQKCWVLVYQWAHVECNQKKLDKPFINITINAADDDLEVDANVNSLGVAGDKKNPGIIEFARQLIEGTDAWSVKWQENVLHGHVGGGGSGKARRTEFGYPTGCKEYGLSLIHI